MEGVILGIFEHNHTFTVCHTLPLCQLCALCALPPLGVAQQSAGRPVYARFDMCASTVHHASAYLNTFPGCHEFVGAGVALQRAWRQGVTAWPSGASGAKFRRWQFAARIVARVCLPRLLSGVELLDDGTIRDIIRATEVLWVCPSMP